MTKMVVVSTIATGILLGSVHAASAAEQLGTFYTQQQCDSQLHQEQRKDVTKRYFCASNGGPASSNSTSWTLYAVPA